MAKRVKYHTNQTPEQHAYLAGIIDGEGCFYIGSNPNKHTGKIQWHHCVKVTSCDESLILWLEKTYGGSKESRYRWTSKKAFYRPVYTWQATCDMLDHVLKSIEPYLVIKKKQCEVMKKYRLTANKVGCNKPISDEKLQRRYELKQQMRNLNSRFHNHPLKSPSPLSP